MTSDMSAERRLLFADGLPKADRMMECFELSLELDLFYGVCKMRR